MWTGVEEATRRGLRVAVEGAAIDTNPLAGGGIENVEELLPLVAPAEQRHAQPWQQVGALAEWSRPAWRVPPDALAAEHLGVPVLDRGARTAFATGWARVLEGLHELVGAGVALAGGSGAPGLGLCPGMALAQERDLWCGAGLAQGAVDDAFGHRAASLTSPLGSRAATPVRGGTDGR